jgi:uncharacterized protein YkwD
MNSTQVSGETWLVRGNCMRAAASLTLAVSCLLLASLSVSPPAAFAGARANVDSRERAIVRAINRQRAGYGLAKLRSNGRLARAADYHSWEMLDADYFAHESRDGGPFDRRVRRFASHRAVGETLAMLGGCGRGSAGQVVRMWMNSPGHRAILLSSTYRRVGIGKRTGRLGGRRACVVTADFASKR